jgi:uncharacterized protein (DUF1810 family)
MSTTYNLERFLEAQKGVFEIALEEIKKGRKVSHWMWFIFPQIKGLGLSEMAKHYAIANLKEAGEYLQHSVLGKRLVEISTELIKHSDTTAAEIFGSVDSMKLRSSMTLFSLAEGADPVFQNVIDMFFGGKEDERTMKLLTTDK